LAERIGAIDPVFEVTEQRIVVRQAVEALPPELRDILEQRYFQGATPQEVARQLGIAQIQVAAWNGGRWHACGWRCAKRLIGTGTARSDAASIPNPPAGQSTDTIPSRRAVTNMLRRIVGVQLRLNSADTGRIEDLFPLPLFEAHCRRRLRPAPDRDHPRSSVLKAGCAREDPPDESASPGTRGALSAECLSALRLSFQLHQAAFERGDDGLRRSLTPNFLRILLTAT